MHLRHARWSGIRFQSIVGVLAQRQLGRHGGCGLALGQPRKDSRGAERPLALPCVAEPSIQSIARMSRRSGGPCTPKCGMAMCVVDRGDVLVPVALRWGVFLLWLALGRASRLVQARRGGQRVCSRRYRLEHGFSLPAVGGPHTSPPFSGGEVSATALVERKGVMKNTCGVVCLCFVCLDVCVSVWVLRVCLHAGAVCLRVRAGMYL